MCEGYAQASKGRQSKMQRYADAAIDEKFHDDNDNDDDDDDDEIDDDDNENNNDECVVTMVIL